jgi:hypothetical protein
MVKKKRNTLRHRRKTRNIKIKMQAGSRSPSFKQTRYKSNRLNSNKLNKKNGKIDPADVFVIYNGTFDQTPKITGGSHPPSKSQSRAPDITMMVVTSDPEQRDLLHLYGARRVELFGPCWWNTIGQYHLSTMRRRHRVDNRAYTGAIYASAERRRLIVSAHNAIQLSEAMVAFSEEHTLYCLGSGMIRVLERIPVLLLTTIIERRVGGVFGRMIAENLVQNIAAMPDRHLTYCEYAAMLCFTMPIEDDEFSECSIFGLLRSTLNFESVRALTGHEYVNRICHPLIMFFYSALHKCPTAYDILADPRHRIRPPPYLHRFLSVDAVVFDAYVRNARMAHTNIINITFYCFQSFSLQLEDVNVHPFLVPDENRNHLIVLRIHITHNTTARYIAQYSFLPEEGELVALPCVPYSIHSVYTYVVAQHHNSAAVAAGAAAAAALIREGSGYQIQPELIALYQRVTVITIVEEPRVRGAPLGAALHG